MKNIQVIDGALNTTYSIYAVSDKVFKTLFPSKGQDIEFADDAIERLGMKIATPIFASIWKRKLAKPLAVGIHGTLFFELSRKKEFYPRKREADLSTLKFVNGHFQLQPEPSSPSDLEISALRVRDKIRGTKGAGKRSS
jgi:hypothetical protein